MPNKIRLYSYIILSALTLISCARVRKVKNVSSGDSTRFTASTDEATTKKFNNWTLTIPKNSFTKTATVSMDLAEDAFPNIDGFKFVSEPIAINTVVDNKASLRTDSQEMYQFDILTNSVINDATKYTVLVISEPDSEYSSTYKITSEGFTFSMDEESGFARLKFSLPETNVKLAVIVNDDTSPDSTIPSEYKDFIAPPNQPSGLLLGDFIDNKASLTWSSGGGTTEKFILSYTYDSSVEEYCKGDNIISSDNVGDKTSYTITDIDTSQKTYFMVCALNSRNPADVSKGSTAETNSDSKWTTISTTNAPSARSHHTAIWSGQKMIVFGGVGDSNNHLNTGGAYDPDDDTWTGIATPSIAGRKYHTAVWGGTVMIVWGGDNNGTSYNDGAVFDPSNNTWSNMTTTGAPSARHAHTAVWDGSKMIVWGGFNGTSYYNDHYTYDPGTDSWTGPIAATGTPVARAWHTATATNDSMVLFGGLNGSGFLSDGGVVSLGGVGWVALSTGGIGQDERIYHTSTYTDSDVVILGGGYNDTIANNNNVDRYLDSGGRIDTSNGNWTNIPAGGGMGPTLGHTAVWTGSQVIVWGGLYASDYRNGDYTDAGSFMTPNDDSGGSWIAMTDEGAPAARAYHTAVWTGSDMIVFGGKSSGTFGDGASYKP